MGKKTAQINISSLESFMGTANQAAAFLKDSLAFQLTLASRRAYPEKMDQLISLTQELVTLFPKAKKDMETLHHATLSAKGKREQSKLSVKSQFEFSTEYAYDALMLVAEYQLDSFFAACQQQPEVSNKKCVTALNSFQHLARFSQEKDKIQQNLNANLQLIIKKLLTQLLKAFESSPNAFLIAIPLSEHILKIEKMVRSAYVFEEESDQQIDIIADFAKICFLIGMEDYGLRFIHQLVQNPALKVNARNPLSTAFEHAVQIELYMSFSSKMHEKIKDYSFLKKIKMMQQLSGLYDDSLEFLKKIEALPLLPTLDAFRKKWDKSKPAKPKPANSYTAAAIEIIHNYLQENITNICKMVHICNTPKIDLDSIEGSPLAVFIQQMNVHKINHFFELRELLFYVQNLFIFFENKLECDILQPGSLLYNTTRDALFLGINNVISFIPSLRQIISEKQKIIKNAIMDLQREETISRLELEELIRSIERDTKKSQKLFKQAKTKAIEDALPQTEAPLPESDDEAIEESIESPETLAQAQINFKMRQARYFWQNYHFTQAYQKYNEVLELAVAVEDKISVTQIKFAMAGVKLSDAKRSLIKLPRYSSSMKLFIDCYDLNTTYDSKKEDFFKEKTSDVWNNLGNVFNYLMNSYPLIIDAIVLFNESIEQILILLNSDISLEKKEQIMLAPEILQEYLDETQKTLKSLNEFNKLLTEWKPKQIARMKKLGLYGQEKTAPTVKSDRTRTLESIQTYLRQQELFLDKQLSHFVAYQKFLSHSQSDLSRGAVISNPFATSSLINSLDPVVNQLKEEDPVADLEKRCQIICQENTPFCIQDAEEYLKLLEQHIENTTANRGNIFPFLTALYSRWSEHQILGVDHIKTVLRLFHLDDYFAEAHAVFTAQMEQRPNEILALYYFDLLTNKITQNPAPQPQQVQTLFEYLTQGYLLLVQQHWVHSDIAKKLQSIIGEHSFLAESFCSAFFIPLENDFSSLNFVHYLYWGIRALGEYRTKLFEKIPNPEQLYDFASWECAFSVENLSELRKKDDFNFDAFISQLRWSLVLRVHEYPEAVIPAKEHLNVLAQDRSLRSIVQINGHIKLAVFYMFGIGLKNPNFPLYQEAKTLLGWAIQETTSHLNEKDQVFWCGMAKNYLALARQLQARPHPIILANPAQTQELYVSGVHQPRFFNAPEKTILTQLLPHENSCNP